MSQWQDISTAPKDGTHVLLFWPNIPAGIKSLKSTSKATGIGVGWFEASESGVGFMCEGDHAVPANQDDCTHWMPLPPAPEAKP
jgi:hypothetical protein